MNRFETISTINEKSATLDYHIDLVSDFGESLTDKSHFQPVASVLAALESGNVGSHVSRMAFDFQDGKDDGRKAPLNRKPVQDIAEISATAQNLDSELKSEVNKAKASEARRRRSAALDAKASESVQKATQSSSEL